MTKLPHYPPRRDPTPRLTFPHSPLSTHLQFYYNYYPNYYDYYDYNCYQSELPPHPVFTWCISSTTTTTSAVLCKMISDEQNIVIKTEKRKKKKKLVST